MVVVLTLSCKSQKNTFQKVPNADRLTLMISEEYSGERTKGFYVVQEAEALRKYFAKINRTRKPGLPIPEIDFSQYVALLFFEGETTVGVSTQKYILEENEDRIVIGSQGNEPSQKPMDTAIGTPFQIYTIPRTEKDIIFK